MGHSSKEISVQSYVLHISNITVDSNVTVDLFKANVPVIKEPVN